MEPSLHNETFKPDLFYENFDCNKMKSLLAENDSKKSFTERFSNWLTQYTKAVREKIWMDIEYFRSK